MSSFFEDVAVVTGNLFVSDLLVFSKAQFGHTNRCCSPRNARISQDPPGLSKICSTQNPSPKSDLSTPVKISNSQPVLALSRADKKY